MNTSIPILTNIRANLRKAVAICVMNFNVLLMKLIQDTNIKYMYNNNKTVKIPSSDLNTCIQIFLIKLLKIYNLLHFI